MAERILILHSAQTSFQVGVLLDVKQSTPEVTESERLRSLNLKKSMQSCHIQTETNVLRQGVVIKNGPRDNRQAGCVLPKQFYHGWNET